MRVISTGSPGEGHASLPRQPILAETLYIIYIRGLNLTQADIEISALNIYDSLRARHDWKEYFESLEVGVRLDLAVAPEEY